MATWDIGDTSTAGNNVDNDLANFASITEAIADAGVNNGDTLRVVRNADIQNTNVTINKQVTIEAHPDCAFNEATYAKATSCARASGTLTISSANVVIKGLRLYKSNQQAITIAATPVTISNCWIEVGTGAAYAAVDINSARICDFYNCIFHAIGTNCEAIFCYSGATVNLYHCSILISSSSASGIDLYGGASANCYSTIVQGKGSNNFLDQGGGTNTFSGDYNVSQDATAPGSSSTKYIRSESGWFTNTDPGTEDLSLVAGKQGYWAANKTAIDQTGWPADVHTDIVGTTRLGVDIDPGVWQTVYSQLPVYNPNKMLIHPGMCGGFPD